MQFESLQQLEPSLRFGFFMGIFALMIIAECLFPRRKDQRRLLRWPSNIGLVVLNTLVVRLILPGATVWVAFQASSWNVGLFNWLSLPSGLELMLAVVALDVGIYWQHRFAHSIPIMWQVHKMHHTDTEYDVTTGSRFHPVEIIISVLIKLVLITVLGASPWAVVLFEIVLNATAMFNHSNFKIPYKIDVALRKVIVTPDMHRIHHSVYPDELNLNFGFNLSLWDRLFHTYGEQPRDGHENMRIGLSDYRATKEARLDSLLTQPFRQPIDAEVNPSTIKS